MKFAELDDKAKEHARDQWRETTCQDDWWDSSYECAVETAKYLGIEVGEYSQKTHSGKTYTKPDIWFSGFSCQGDGCCFSGSLELQGLEGAIERVKAHTGQDDELAKLAVLAESIFAQANAKAVMQRLSDLDPVDADFLRMDGTLSIFGKERCYSTSIDNFDDGDVFLEDDLNNLVEGFAGWIYKMLEAESDYQNSDEAIDESIEANDVEFDEAGCC